MDLLLNILFIVLSLLAAAGVGLLIFFKLTVSIRDSRRRPAEKRLGQGARKALLLYQPSNGRRNVPQAEALAARLAEMGYAVTVNHPSEDCPMPLGTTTCWCSAPPSTWARPPGPCAGTWRPIPLPASGCCCMWMGWIWGAPPSWRR